MSSHISCYVKGTIYACLIRGPILSSNCDILGIFTAHKLDNSDLEIEKKGFADASCHNEYDATISHSSVCCFREQEEK